MQRGVWADNLRNFWQIRNFDWPAQAVTQLKLRATNRIHQCPVPFFLIAPVPSYKHAMVTWRWTDNVQLKPKKNAAYGGFLADSKCTTGTFSLAKVSYPVNDHEIGSAPASP